jgi:hypothetical protein
MVLATPAMCFYVYYVNYVVKNQSVSESGERSSKSLNFKLSTLNKLCGKKNISTTLEKIPLNNVKSPLTFLNPHTTLNLQNNWVCREDRSLTGKKKYR